MGRCRQLPGQDEADGGGSHGSHFHWENRGALSLPEIRGQLSLPFPPASPERERS